MLHEINVVHLQPLERLIQLLRCFLLRASVDLGHQENLLAIAVAEGFAHPPFTLTVVVVPTVVHEVDTAIDCIAHNAQAEFFRNVLEAEMPTPNSDSRHLLSRSP